MKKEIKFNKYQKRKAYHWKQASFNIFTGNCFVRERYEQCVSAIKSNLEVTNNTKILDYGCGDGYLTHLISKLTPNAYGTDLSKESIENCKCPP